MIFIQHLRNFEIVFMFEKIYDNYMYLGTMCDFFF